MIKRFSKHSLTNSFKTNTTRISLNLHLLAARKFFKPIRCHTYCFNVELIVAFVIAINHYNCNWLKQFVSQTTTSLLVNTLLYRPKHRWHCWSTQWHFYLIDHRIRLAWIDIYNHIPPIFHIFRNFCITCWLQRFEGCWYVNSTVVVVLWCGSWYVWLTTNP